ncbi:mucin-5AC-like isoform X2 [Mya arenaria]|uniref:mucin-5AC-like isoform X2 n=1 Tax=Mya arenaria TaxID=6604 RepID=UPI0022E98960|nr:mucin-5AC-like isoform X2 [Mya arenaria]
MKTRQESNRRKLKRPKPTEEDTLNTSSAAKETVIKTPQIKTPRGVRRNAVRTTPGRDEIVFSQNFDSQAVVGWDCNSPLNVGRVHRGGDGQDVSDLLKLIADEDEGSLPQGNTPPLLGAWKVGASKEDGTTEDNNNEVSGRLLRKGRTRKKSGKDSSVSRDLFEKLSLALEHCAEADNELEDVTEDAETEPINDNRVVLNVSGDLFDTTKVEKPSVGNAPVKTENHWANKVPVRVSPRLQKKIEVKTGTNVISPIDANFENVVQGASKISTDVLNCAQTDVNEDDWSDDELFEEDSFIIKATQIPGEEKNFNSPVFGIKRKSSNATDLPKSKISRFTFKLDSHNTKTSTTVRSTSSNYTNIQSKPKPLPLSTTSSVPSHPIGLTKSTYVQQYARPGSSNTVTSTRSSLPHAIIRVNDSVLASPRTAQNFYPKPAGQSNLNHSRTVRNLNSSVVGPSSQMSSSNSSRTFASKQIIPNQSSSGAMSSNVYNSTKLSQNSPSSCSLNRSNSFKKHNSFSGPGNAGPATQSTRKRSISGSDEKFQVQQTVSTASAIQPSARPGNSCNTISKTGAYSVTNNQNNANRLSSGTQNPQSFQHGIWGQKVVTSVQKLPSRMVAAQSASKSFATKVSSVRTSSVVSTSSVSVLTTPVLAKVRAVGKTVNSMNSSFDTSLSDDLLFQLAEPDDLLDTQMEQDLTFTRVQTTPVVSVKMSAVTSSSLFAASTCSLSTVSSKHVISSTEVSHKPKTVQSSIVPKASCLNAKALCSYIPKQTSTFQSKASVNSSTKPIAQTRHFRFKESQKSTGCNISKLTAPLPASSNRDAFAKPPPASSVQSVVAKPDPMVAFSEDLFGDDDMLGDDGLTEPEIMAMLDEVEFQATQQLSQKRTSTESVKSLTGSQESTLRLQPQAVKPSETSLPNSPAETIQPSSQGSNGNSPAKNSQTKYSPEEIERKKQLALQKRRLKIHK